MTLTNRCAYLLFVVGCSEVEWVEKGYRNWKKFLDPTSGFKKHASSRMHQLSAERFTGYCNANANLTVHEQLSEQARKDRSRKDAEKSENREVVQIIFDCVLFLSKQGMPFRGHDESETSSNRGNFIELLHFLAKYCPQIQKWLASHPGNVTYMSAEIQDEMISIIANKIRSELSSDITDAGEFSLICDEVSDVANGEWITVVIRYVKGAAIKECLLHIVPICDLHANALCATVTKTLMDNNVRIAKIVAQCYDGASNMSGQYGGLQAKIKEVVGDHAAYIHCYAHVLNLVNCDTMKNNRLADNIFGTLQKLYAFIEGSPKRHHVYISCIDEHCPGATGKQLLQTLCNTRWSARADNLEVVVNCFPAIVAALTVFKEDGDANGLLHTMKTLNFMFGVHVLHRILKYCKSASDCLQTEDLDLAAAVIGIADLTRKLQDMRTDAECRSQYDLAISKMHELSTKFPDFLQSAEAAGTAMDTVEKPKRSRKVPKRLQDCVNDTFLAETPVTDVYDKLRVDFYFPVLDLVLVNLRERFEGKNKVIMDGVAALQFNSLDVSSSVKAVENFAELYIHCGVSVSECSAQFELAVNNKLLCDRSPKTLKTAWEVFCEHNLTLLYGQLAKLLKIAVTLPVTSASAERVHSKVKLVKTALRSTSADERMSDLIQIYVERSIADNLGLGQLVSEFALKPRKLLL